jgi:hypothetical protein
MRLIEQGTIYDAQTASSNERYAFFDSLLRMSDGNLLCSYKTGSAKISTHDRLRFKYSRDGGTTWLDINSDLDLSKFGPGSSHAGFVNEIAPGLLFLNCLWVDRTNPDLPFISPKTSGMLPTAIITAKSLDRGKTWQSWQKLDFAHHKWIVPCDKIVTLKNGDLLLPYENWRGYDDSAGHHSGAFLLSRDRGNTWSRPVVYAQDPFADFYFYDARVTIEPETGRLAVLLWTYDNRAGKDAPIHIAFGSPDARNWSYPVSTGIAGQIAAPLAIGNDQLLTVYVHRHDPPSIRVKRSLDFGKTWQDNEFVIYTSNSGTESGAGKTRTESEFWDDISRWSFGHPSAVIVEEKIVLISYYAGNSSHLSIKWAKIELD